MIRLTNLLPTHMITELGLSMPQTPYVINLTEQYTDIETKGIKGGIWTNYIIGNPAVAHMILDAAALAAFIVLPGWGGVLVGGAIELSNAGVYWAEGNKYDAGMYAIFAILPVIGKGLSVAAKTFLKSSNNIKRIISATKSKAHKLGAVGDEILQYFTKNSKWLAETTKTYLRKQLRQVIVKTGISAFKQYPRLANTTKIVLNRAGRTVDTLNNVILNLSIRLSKLAGKGVVAVSPLVLWSTIMQIYDKVYYWQANKEVDKLTALLNKIDADIENNPAKYNKKLTSQDIESILDSIDSTVDTSIDDFIPTAVNTNNIRIEPNSMKQLSVGMVGPEVKELQTRLNINPDGKFGPNTKNAVIAFQKKYNLNSDGIVGPNTWAKLFNVTSKSQFKKQS